MHSGMLADFGIKKAEFTQKFYILSNKRSTHPSGQSGSKAGVPQDILFSEVYLKIIILEVKFLLFLLKLIPPPAHFILLTDIICPSRVSSSCLCMKVPQFNLLSVVIILFFPCRHCLPWTCFTWNHSSVPKACHLQWICLSIAWSCHVTHCKCLSPSYSPISLQHTFPFSPFTPHLVLFYILIFLIFCISQ